MRRIALLTLLIASLTLMTVYAGDFMPLPEKRGGKQVIEYKKPQGKIGAYSQVDLLNAFEMSGDQLLRWQHVPDGGWTWPEDFSSTSTATPYSNQIGVVARALIMIDQKIPAKDYVGDGSYPGAAYSGERLMLTPVYYNSESDRNNLYAPDRTHLAELSDYTGDMDYITSAVQEWTKVKDIRPGWDTGEGLAEYFAEKRAKSGYFTSSQMYGYGLSIWDLAGYAIAAEKLGDHQYAKAIIDTYTTEHDFPIPPGDPFWNDTANGYSKNCMANYLKRWDDSTATSDTAEKEGWFFGSAGHMLWAMNLIDEVAFASWIDELKTRLVAEQDPSGAFIYTKYGETGVSIQDQGYAMMGLRHIGEINAGQMATDWAIANQETSGMYKGMWRETTGESYQENNSEMTQGMWEVAEGEDKPWVQVTVSPMGSHVNQVPFSFKIFDLGSNPATVMIEWTRDDGDTWNETDRVTGPVTGLATSPSGVEHDLVWNSFPEIPASPPSLAQADCQIRITARDDSNPTGWGFPQGLTAMFTVDNTTIPVELSIFNLE